MLSIRQLEATLRAVIRTAGSAQLSESHAAAACDALRGCLTQCEDSANAKIRALAFSSKTWIDIFNVFLRTSGSRRSKPLKLLLTALERNLVKNPSQLMKDDLAAYISLSNWQTISAHNDNYAIKPALQALRHFLSKSVIQARDIVLAVSQSQVPNKHGQAQAHVSNNYPASLDRLSISESIDFSHVFLCKVLSWVRYPDAAPITGRLVSTFCCSLRRWSLSWPKTATVEENRYGDQPSGCQLPSLFCSYTPISLISLLLMCFQKLYAKTVRE